MLAKMLTEHSTTSERIIGGMGLDADTHKDWMRNRLNDLKLNPHQTVGTTNAMGH